jgi:hypothetical protein
MKPTHCILPYIELSNNTMKMARGIVVLGDLTVTIKANKQSSFIDKLM